MKLMILSLSFLLLWSTQSFASSNKKCIPVSSQELKSFFDHKTQWTNVATDETTKRKLSIRFDVNFEEPTKSTAKVKIGANEIPLTLREICKVSANKLIIKSLGKSIEVIKQRKDNIITKGIGPEMNFRPDQHVEVLPADYMNEETTVAS